MPLGPPHGSVVTEIETAYEGPVKTWTQRAPALFLRRRLGLPVVYASMRTSL